LTRLGIEARANALKASATPDQAMEIDSAIVRLTDMSRTGMGEMFKVMGFSHPSLRSLPGWSADRRSAKVSHAQGARYLIYPVFVTPSSRAKAACRMAFTRASMAVSDRMIRQRRLRKIVPAWRRNWLSRRDD
jgi:hypothetical protein